MWLGYDVRDNSTAVFAPPQRKSADVLKIPRPPVGCSTNRLIVDVENDPNVSITTAEYFPRAEIVNKSDLKPITSRRTDLYHHEKVKLFQDIDSAINKSRALVDSLEKLPETGSDLIEIDFDEDGHRKLTEASYTAMPYKVSVRSTLPPKIRVNGQRPEITRKSLGGKEYHLERRQPDVTLSYDDRRPWKVAFHGGNLEYPKYLEKKHGERGINRYFRTRKMEEAEESLRAEKRVGWDDVSDEYRKELKRQSEMRRLQGPSEKWWELTTPEFHYNHHKALDAERRCSSQAETYRRGLKKNSDLFWTY